MKIQKKWSEVLNSQYKKQNTQWESPKKLTSVFGNIEKQLQMGIGNTNHNRNKSERSIKNKNNTSY